MNEETWLNDQTLVETAYSREAGAVVANDYLHINQFRHAVLTSLVPAIGVVVAIVQIFWRGLGWFEIAILAFMYFLTVTGMEVGFHRLFTHRSFTVVRPVKILLAILGSMCGQGPVVNWVSTHRRHHQHSDKELDPHSPYHPPGNPKGFWRGLVHSYVGWIYTHETSNPLHFARDVLQDPLIYRVNRLYLFWILLGLAIPAAIGGAVTQTWFGAWNGFLWGGLVRMFLVHQATFTVTSFCHVFGSRPFQTHEESRNNVWLIIPTFGQAWHNNHHAFPSSAIMGLKWWQVDLGAYVIHALRWLGLARNIRRPPPAVIATLEKAAHPTE